MALKLLTTTTTGQILTENNQGCQEPRSKGTGIHEYPVRQWGFILPVWGVWECLLQGTGKPAGGVVKVLGLESNHGATSSMSLINSSA